MGRERERGAWPYRHLLACVNKSLFPMKLRGGRESRDGLVNFGVCVLR
jgi:hypothetical protein